MESEVAKIKPFVTVSIMSCLDAMALYDGREIWYYLNEHNIIWPFFNRGYCWDALAGRVDDNSKVITYPCHYGNNQRYLMNSDGKLRILQDTNRCLTAMGDVLKDNVILNSKCVASSTIDDTEHKPERVCEGKDSYWASAFNEEQVEFKVIFGSTQVIREIDIDFKYAPKAFEVGGLSPTGVWESYASFTRNNKKQLKLRVGIRKLDILKINFKKFHPSLSKIRKVFVYGLNKIKASGVYKALKFRECKFGDDKKTNVWSLEYIDHLSLSENIVKDNEWKKAQSNVNQLMPVLNQVLQVPAVVEKTREKAKEMREWIEKIKVDLKNLAVKLTVYENWVKIPEEDREELPSGLGASSSTPGNDCYTLKRAYPSKISGYYWIKPDCTPNPVRAYCDFEFDNALSYAYYGSTAAGKFIPNIYRPEHLQHHCAKIGMEAVEIKSKDHLGVILRYIKDLELDLTTGAVVPLGYDYSCNLQCTGRYSSLASSISPDRTNEFMSFKDKKNVVNLAFTGGGQDTVGVGMNMGKVFFFKLVEFPIQGLICSTNFDGKGAPGYFSADCLAMPRGNPEFDGSANTAIKVICPAGCTAVENAKVWGDITYKDDSSICRAAIHAGAIKGDKGGKLMLVLGEAGQSFSGSENFGVKTETFPDKWDRTFIINAYKEKCPIEKFEKKKSFIEESSTLQGKDVSFLKDIDDPAAKSNLLKILPEHDIESKLVREGSNRFESVDSPHDNGLPQGTEPGSMPERPDNADMLASIPPNNKIALSSDNTKAIFSGSTQESKSDSNTNSNTNSDSNSNSNSKSDSKSSNSNSDSKSNSDSSSNDDGQQADGEEDQEEEGNNPSKPKDSMEAKKFISKNYEKYSGDMRKMVRLIKETNALFERINTSFGPLLTTDISADSLMNDHNKYNQVARATALIIWKLSVKANNRVKRRYRELQLARIEKLKLEMWKEYKEDYYFWISDIYEIWDSPNAIGKPSNWQFTKKTLGKHDKQISQTSSVRCMEEKGCKASFLVLKYKNFYDFKLKFSFMIRDDGDVGVVFRLNDEFNYYVFEMNNILGYKRFRRVSKGKSIVLGEIRESKLAQDKWYNVQLEVNLFTFTAKIGLESDGKDGDNLPTVLVVEEQLLAGGRVGFLTNNNKAFFIDNFEFIPVACWKEPKLPDLEYIAPECNRFLENYFGAYNQRWKTKDPPGYQNGPSTWKFMVNIGERKRVIYQQSDIKSSLPDKIGTISYLDYNKKIIRDGYLKVEIFAKKDGILGILFRYHDYGNYYTFEVGGEAAQFLQLRKNVGGRFHSISKEMGRGYKIGVWYSVEIYLIGPKIKIFFQEVGEALMEAFGNIEDEDLKVGTVGFSSFMTPVAFDNFKFHPIGDLVFEKGEEEDKKTEDIPLKQLVLEDKKVVFDNANIKKLNWDICIDTASPDDRNKFCAEKYSAAGKDAIKFCSQNFCKMCCEDIIDWLHPVMRQTCNKECTEAWKPSKTVKEWETCINPSKPLFSTYKYCAENFAHPIEASFCKKDFCDLCCVTSGAIFQKSLSDESIHDCHTKCLSKFSDHKDIIF